MVSQINFRFPFCKISRIVQFVFFTPQGFLPMNEIAFSKIYTLIENKNIFEFIKDKIVIIYRYKHSHTHINTQKRILVQ